MKLKLENVSKSYGKFEALKDFSYEFSPGIYGLLGQNGAGKSTLMNIISGAIKQSKGDIFFNGQKTIDLGKDYRKKLGYLPQISGYYKNFTAFEFLKYVALLKGISDKKEMENEINTLLHKVNLQDASNKKLGGYSGGMRQRVGIAQALLGNPDVLIFDEPTAGLDPKERIRFRNIISELAYDKIILVATHIVSDIEMAANQILVIKEGRLLQSGTIESCLECLNGKVFSANMNQKDLSIFSKNHKIVGVFRISNDLINVRFIEESGISDYGQEIQPTLEDMYLFYFDL